MTPHRRCVVSGDIVFLEVGGTQLRAEDLRCDAVNRGFSIQLLPARETDTRGATATLPIRIFRHSRECARACCVKIWHPKGNDALCLVDVLPSEDSTL